MNQRIETFLKRILPNQAQLDLAKAELDYLESKLADFIEDDDSFEFVKALRAGSYAKHTMLRRHSTGDFDADLGVYVKTESNGEDVPIGDLLDYLETLLRRAYKKRTERTPRIDRSSKSSVKVKFEVTPKITLDVAPIVALEHPSIPNWGAIPRRDGEKRKTSVTEHVRFVSSRNKLAPKCPFNQTERLWKWWRDHRFSDTQKQKVNSFFLELVLGKAFDEIHDSLTGAWLEDLRKMAAWVVRHGLQTEIAFPDKRVPPARKPVTDPVIVLDPLNRSNNVAHDWTLTDRELFADAAQEFCDLVREAQLLAEEGEEEEAIATLDQVFPHFKDWSRE